MQGPGHRLSYAASKAPTNLLFKGHGQVQVNVGPRTKPWFGMMGKRASLSLQVCLNGWGALERGRPRPQTGGSKGWRRRELVVPPSRPLQLRTNVCWRVQQEWKARHHQWRNCVVAATQTQHEYGSCTLECSRQGTLKSGHQLVACWTQTASTGTTA